MKKLISVLVLLSLGLFCAQSTHAQIVPTQPAQFPAPYVSNTYLYQSPNGAEVPYDIVYGPAGIVYTVFDPSVNQVLLQQAFVMAQAAAATAGVNSAKLVPLIVPGVVATGQNVFEIRTTNDFSVNNGGSGATLATVPNLGAYVGAQSTYAFRAVLYVVLGAGGSKIDFGGPASPTNVIADVQATGGTAIVYSSQATAFLSAPGGSNTTTVTKILIEGTFTTNNGGIFVIQFAQNTGNAANSTVKAGSTLTVTQLP